MQPISLYLHIPFCTHRCGYCDFNTYAGQESLIPAYISALCVEIRACHQAAGWRFPVHTIFFGGGTPSLMSSADLESILAQLDLCFDLQSNLEISLEANPGTLSLPYLQDVRKLGINRISLGVQSANPSELRLLERIHDYPDVIQSFTWARRAGFDNINLDLIFGLPEQTLETWQKTLKVVCGLHPEHFSLYALTIEHDTPFGSWERRGILSSPDPDLAADMYEWAASTLEERGYLQYEISNWALQAPGEEVSPGASPTLSCRHNLQYWRNLPYLGLGAGGHGYAAGVRTANVLLPISYIKRMEIPIHTPLRFPRTPATHTAQEIDEATEIGETMMMGLRLIREGVSDTKFSARFMLSLEDQFPAQIDRLIGLGLLEWALDGPGKSLRLTPRGHLLANRVFIEFI